MSYSRPVIANAAHVIYKGKEISTKKFCKKIKGAEWDANDEMLILSEVKQSIPGLTSVGDDLILSDYDFELPDLQSVFRIDLESYHHSLPSLVYVCDDLDLTGFDYELPKLVEVGEALNVFNCLHDLPALRYADRITGLDDYTGSLPNLRIVGDIDLSNYNNELPKLKEVIGELTLNGYKFKLPKLKKVITVDFGEYDQKLKCVIKGGIDSRAYKFIAVYVGDKISGEWRIRAGCRDFSVQDALNHWHRHGNSPRRDCIKIVKQLAKEVQERIAAKKEKNDKKVKVATAG